MPACSCANRGRLSSSVLYDNPVPSLNHEEGATTIPLALKCATGVGAG